MAELRREQAAFAAAAFNTKLQQALTFLGFYDGPIDGLESPELTAALAAFQASVGLPPTGVFDAATDAALRAALGEFSDLFNSSTRDLQILLTDLGFYSGPIDGIWSPELTEAVKALQRELGVPETGVIDAADRAGHLRARHRHRIDHDHSGRTRHHRSTRDDRRSHHRGTHDRRAHDCGTGHDRRSPEPPTTEPPALPPTDNLLATLADDPDFTTFFELVLQIGLRPRRRATRAVHGVRADERCASDPQTLADLKAMSQPQLQDYLVVLPRRAGSVHDGRLAAQRS